MQALTGRWGSGNLLRFLRLMGIRVLYIFLSNEMGLADAPKANKKKAHFKGI